MSSKRQQKEVAAAASKQEAKLTQAQVPCDALHCFEKADCFYNCICVQTLRAKEGGAELHYKQAAQKNASSSFAAGESAPTSKAASQPVPKENISYGNVAVGGKTVNSSHDKSKKVIPRDCCKHIRR
jgi:hypothetical protein